MTEFEKLVQIHEAHGTAWAAFKSAINACGDAAKAISARIHADQEAHEDLVEQLQEMSKDEDRSEGSRRLAGLELERIRGQRFRPTEDELCMYKRELERAEEALRDVRILGERYRGAHDAALVRLMGLRKNVLGNGGLVGADNQLDSVRKTYDKLYKEVNGNG